MEEINAWKIVDNLVKKNNNVTVDFFNKSEETDDLEEIIYCRKYINSIGKWLGCGEPGHTFRTCPMNICKICNQRGHIHIDCPFMYTECVECASPIKDLQ